MDIPMNLSASMSEPKLVCRPEPKLVCRKVWKLFGARASAILSAHGGHLDAAMLAAEGLVGAVRGVDLDVHVGEIFVIMGLSGSGKSTLVRLMSRLVEPSAGEILFKGENLLSASTSRMIEIRRHQMGMVFQHFALLPHLTVIDNVAFPLDIQGMNRTRRLARAREMIELVGLNGKEQAFPRELSGGQQQRVGIARSLAVEPEIWFLDEPFSALDPLIRREMQDEFLRLQGALHKTIVFITHDFDEAIRLADRIAIMKDGRIEQTGTPEDVVMRPATPYVAEFTRDVPKAKVLRVGGIMSPDVSVPAEGSVPAESRVMAVAARMREATGPLAVVDAAGRRVGTLTRDAVADAMLGG